MCPKWKSTCIGIHECNKRNSLSSTLANSTVQRERKIGEKQLPKLNTSSYDQDLRCLYLVHAIHKRDDMYMGNVAVYEYANWHIYPWHSFGAQIQSLCNWPSHMLIRLKLCQCLQVGFKLFKHCAFHTYTTLKNMPQQRAQHCTTEIRQEHSMREHCISHAINRTRK